MPKGNQVRAHHINRRKMKRDWKPFTGNCFVRANRQAHKARQNLCLMAEGDLYDIMPTGISGLAKLMCIINKHCRGTVQ